VGSTLKERLVRSSPGKYRLCPAEAQGLGVVRYHPPKSRTDLPRVYEWSGVEFVGRMAALIPSPRKHMVRYYGALGPRSPLRTAVSSAARGKANAVELEAGYSITVLGKVERGVLQVVRASARSWAACVKRIFEVDPVRCVRCGTEMQLAAIIIEDRELDRILAHQGWTLDFPKTKASRSPPGRGPGVDGESQVDDRGEEWEVRRDRLEDVPA
jgi:hypothetical protein